MGKVAKNNPSKTNKKTKDVQKQGKFKLKCQKHLNSNPILIFLHQEYNSTKTLVNTS